MNQPQPTKLTRKLGLLALTATGVCSMLGASINVVLFMIQRNVPGIGPYVLPAFAFAAIPALFAAFAYGILASAMPRAGRFKDINPANALVQARLVGEGYLVEIETEAVIR